MNNELEIYRQRVKIGWLIAGLIVCTVIFTLGVFVSPTVSMSNDAHGWIFGLSFFTGGGFGIACIADIFCRIKKIEDHACKD